MLEFPRLCTGFNGTAVPQRTFLALIPSSDPLGIPNVASWGSVEFMTPIDFSPLTRAAALAGNQRLNAKLRQQAELWRMGAVMNIQQRKFQDGKAVRDPQ